MIRVRILAGEWEAGLARSAAFARDRSAARHADGAILPRNAWLPRLRTHRLGRGARPVRLPAAPEFLAGLGPAAYALPSFRRGTQAPAVPDDGRPGPPVNS